MNIDTLDLEERRMLPAFCGALLFAGVATVSSGARTSAAVTALLD